MAVLFLTRCRITIVSCRLQTVSSILKGLIPSMKIETVPPTKGSYPLEIDSGGKPLNSISNVDNTGL